MSYGKTMIAWMNCQYEINIVYILVVLGENECQVWLVVIVIISLLVPKDESALNDEW